MTSDNRNLVERLRACELEYLDGHPIAPGAPINPDGPEAANEIERLRANQLPPGHVAVPAEKLRSALDIVRECRVSLNTARIIMHSDEARDLAGDVCDDTKSAEQVLRGYLS